MRNRWVRRVVLGLVFVFPLLLGAVSESGAGRTSRGLAAAPPLLAVEGVLVGGVVFAGRQRRRLLAELEAAKSKPRWLPSSPASALAGPKVASKARALGLAQR